MIAVLLAAGDQHVLRAAGPQAARVEQVWWVYLAVSTLVCALVTFAVLYAVFRRRARAAALEAPALGKDAQPIEPPERPVAQLDPVRERKFLRRVGWSTGATIVALFVLLGESIVAGRAIDGLSTRGALHIAVTAKQWWWQIHYPDSEPGRSFYTANEIHIPVGRTVVFELRSSDVIHSLWIPNLHGKRDLIPGRKTTLELRADRPGRYRSQCAEFCGYAHAQMSLWVVAEPAAAFEAWRNQQRAPATTPQNPLEQRGQQVFMNAPCASCHTITGTGAQSTVGPDLTHVASRLSLAAATIPNRRGYLAGWLVGSQSLKPGNHMPNLTLAPDDLHALIAYLESLR
jgi:cytochrome c oxidase subunit 2